MADKTARRYSACNKKAETFAIETLLLLSFGGTFLESLKDLKYVIEYTIMVMVYYGTLLCEKYSITVFYMNSKFCYDDGVYGSYIFIK